MTEPEKPRKKYVVTHVSHDFDGYVEGVECLAVFNSQEDADQFVQSRRDTAGGLRKMLIDHIDAFVEGVIVPEFRNGTPGVYGAWMEWVEKWPCHSSYVTPANFKENLKSYLIAYWPNFKHHDFHLPDMSGLNSDRDLFVVEVTCE